MSYGYGCPDGYIREDDAVDVVLENGWLTEENLAELIERCTEKSFKKLKKLLEARGIEIRRLPQNPSQRDELVEEKKEE
jgi:hypothetical protein